MAQVRKAVMAALGIAAQAVASGMLPERYRGWGAVILALATAVGVYAVPNASPADAR